MENKTLTYQMYVNREGEMSHLHYAQEYDFYNHVKNGDIEEIKKKKNTDFTKQEGLGKLSEDALRSAKYHFVIATAMVTRYCIEGGLDFETAYTMSDIYINRADKVTSTSQLSKLQYDMLLSFTKEMRELNKKNSYSLPIRKCVDYIYSNLHTPLHMNDLAKTSGLSGSYLSRLFKSETGFTLTDYITSIKLSTAKNMLLHSEEAIPVISEALCFASQSYFTLLFKRKYGSTPFVYRKLNKGRFDL